jgi:hypothetical protein
MDILDINMNRILPQRFFFTAIFLLIIPTLAAQKILSEKSKIHINSTVVETVKPPEVQIISPVGLRQGVTFQADKQNLSLGIRILNNTSEVKVFVNNIEVPSSGAGDIHLKDLELKRGTNNISVLVRQKDKVISENNYSLLFIPEMKNLSPFALNIGKNYALIVANGTYMNPSIQSLKRPVLDAKELRDVLVSKYTFDPDNIYFLQDMKRANLMMALDELQEKLKPEDNLLIYYAGHGKMDEASKRGYWLLADADPSSRVEWFNNSTLIDYIKGFNAKHVLLVADACFAGSIFYSRSVFDDAPPPIQDVYKNKSRTAMTSGGTTEVNDESKFSEMLLKYLKENSSQYFTSSQLFRLIENSVMNTKSTAPRFGIIEDTDDNHGDFVFILKNN